LIIIAPFFFKLRKRKLNEIIIGVFTKATAEVLNRSEEKSDRLAEISEA